MRRTFFLAALLFSAAPAQAAPLPAATEPGITVARESGGAYVVSFTAQAYRSIAGRRLSIACTSSVERSPAAGPPKRFVSRLTTPAKVAPIRLRPRPGTDVCAFAKGSASSAGTGFLVALDTSARRFLADYETASGVQEIVGLAAAAGRTHASWPAYAELPTRVRRQVGHLTSPTAVPSGKRYAYYSDGRRRMTVVGVSASGRRLVFSMDGEDAATNIVPTIDVLGAPDAPSGTLPVGPFPPAGTPLPDATVAGVTATQQGREVQVAFSGSDAEAAYGRLAGRRVAAVCTRTEQPVLGLLLGQQSATSTVTAPAAPTTLRFEVGAGSFSTCSLAVAAGAPVVQVAAGEAGRARRENGLTSRALQAVARRAAGNGPGAYASAPSLATSFADATVVLATPADTPADRRVGVFSDQASHLAVVARAMTGQRLYAEFSGSILRTNLLGVTDLIPFA